MGRLVGVEHPVALLLLLPVVALWAYGLRRRARLGEPAAPLRRRLVAGARLALLVTLALSLAGPAWQRRSTRALVVLLVDVSRSTDDVPDLDARLRRWLAEAPLGALPDDRLAVVAFARDATTVHAPAAAVGVGVPGPPQVTGARDTSDLAAAIAQGLGEITPEDNGRLVLLSDGDETRGDAAGAASRAAAAGVPVDVLPLTRTPRRDVAAVRLRTPSQVEGGAPVDLALVTRADRAGTGRAELLRDGRTVSVTAARWGAGEDVVYLRDTGLDGGLHRYEARLVPDNPDDDAVPGNERAAGFVRVSGGARAVVVAGRYAEGGGSVVAEALRRAGMTVDRVDAASAPEGVGAWGRYDLVVLSDVRARELDVASLATLREQVRAAGAGLWMLGSDAAFGPGGYAGTAVEEVLPVTLDLRQHRLRGDVALVIVIDRSGSMAATTRDGRTKLTLANEGAARAAALLAPGDRIAIGHVDTETGWTLPLRTADNPAAIARAAHRGTPGGGGIRTDVALRDAYALLHDAHATIRHVLVLADGDDAEESDACPPLAAAALRGHITTSVVAIGRGHDEASLAAIAAAGGGRYYLTEEAHTLPTIFTEDTTLSARNPLREEGFVPRYVRGAEVLRGVAGGEAVRVAGYVVAEARPRAEVLARALDDDPWLTRWQVGVGRAAALQSDLDGRWTADFLRTPASTALVSQLGLWLARGVHDRRTQTTALAMPGRVRVVVDAALETGGYDTGATLEAQVVSPAGTSVRVPLEARGPGRYEAEVEAPRTGSYLVTVLRPGVGVVGVTGAEVSASAERTGRAANLELLGEIAARSGGTVRHDLRGLFAGPRVVKTARVGWGRALWAVALGWLLLGAAFARLPAPPLARWRARWTAWRGRTRTNAPEETPAAVETPLVRLRAHRATRGAPATTETVTAPTAPTPDAAPAQPAQHTTEAEGSLAALAARKRKRRGE